MALDAPTTELARGLRGFLTPIIGWSWGALTVRKSENEGCGVA